MRAVKYGVTRDYVMGLEVVLPSGDVINLGSKCIKDVVGYDLTTLFIGSEGTLGIITRAILKLVPLPEAHKTMTAEFPSINFAAKAVPEIIKNRIIPSALEFLDHHCIYAVDQYLKVGLDPKARAFLLIEVDGPASALDRTIRRINEICLDNGAITTKIAENDHQRNRLWEIRRAVSTALDRYKLRGDHQDVSVPRTRIPEVIEKMNVIAEENGLFAINFGHVGDGNLHFTLAEKDGPVDESRVKTAMNQIMRAVVSTGGRVAAEHGIGLLKRDKMLLNTDSASLELMMSLKNLLDPDNLLNPGKIFFKTYTNT